jgi:long-chain acyl-CoA synthetase
MTSERDLGTGISQVGMPFPSLEIRLADIPDMRYFHSDRYHNGIDCVGRGEIEVRGPHVFKGYYKDNEATRDVLDDDGWLKTGDVGMWLPQGQLAIIDRKKNLFKLSQGTLHTYMYSIVYDTLIVISLGEYIAVEKLENIFSSAKLVAQVFVYGESTQDCLVAVVVPDADTLYPMMSKMAGTSDISLLSMSEICSKYSSIIKEKIIEEFTFLAERHGLRGFEAIKNISIEATQWTNIGEDSILTPTMKLKRQKAKEKYAAPIHAMYEELKAGSHLSHPKPRL